MQDILYKIALTLTPSIGPVTAKQLVSYCGGVEEVFKASKKQLLAIPKIGEVTANTILKKEAFQKAEEELKFVEKNNIEVLFYFDEKFPRRLKHYDDCPLLLYYKGKADLNRDRMVAIVGTRTPSDHGRAHCEEIVNGLKAYTPTIISGLAYGIDITAHRKCLQVGVPTIGILGNGLSSIYPSTHRKTANEMMENGGGILTEFVSDAKPDREHFPMRNRIIAGMCDALIVVETARSGGSMISVEYAHSYHKDIFAVPGRVSDPMSVGCNHIIKTQKAHLLENASDLAYIMQWEESTSGMQKKLFVELTTAEQEIVDILRANEEAMTHDHISYNTTMRPSVLASHLLSLEFKGVIKSLPGKRYLLL